MIIRTISVKILGGEQVTDEEDADDAKEPKHEDREEKTL